MGVEGSSLLALTGMEEVAGFKGVTDLVLSNFSSSEEVFVVVVD